MHEESEDSIGTRENNWNKYVFISELSSARPFLFSRQTLYVQFVHAVTQLVAVVLAATCCLYSYLEVGKGNQSTNLTVDWKMILRAE